MASRKNARGQFLLIGLFLLCGCRPEFPDALVNKTTPSRYDLITAEKVSQEMDNYPPIIHNSGWDIPHPINGAVNSAGLEDSPFITSDGNTLFFFYTPSSNSPAEVQINDRVTGIYRTEKINGVWQEPDRVLLTAGNNAVSLDGCPFFLNDMLWFCSIREGNFRDIDIWTAHWNGSTWENIVNVGAYLNQELQIGEMHISQDSSTLFFQRESGEGLTGLDLWQTQKKTNGWGPPQPIEQVNSPDDDSRPALSPDGQELWFTRIVDGTPAIFRSQWVNGSWGEPELIISQFAGEPSLDNQENIYFTHHFFKEGKMVEADIYLAKKK